jgi:hypothetical protein
VWPRRWVVREDPSRLPVELEFPLVPRAPRGRSSSTYNHTFGGVRIGVGVPFRPLQDADDPAVMTHHVAVDNGSYRVSPGQVHERAASPTSEARFHVVITEAARDGPRGGVSKRVGSSLIDKAAGGFGVSVPPASNDCNESFTDESGTTIICNRPKGHKISADWQGKHYRWVGDRVWNNEPFFEGPRVITKKPNQPRW